MTTQANISELKRLFALLKAEVELETAASLADLKAVIAEVILLEPLRVAFNLPELVSLNVIEKRNFPAIDLGDKSKRVAFQVTATSDISKIRSTANSFIEHGLYKQYDELYILLLTDSKNYRVDVADFSGGKFIFDKEHIVDLGQLFAKISTLEDPVQISRLVQLLQSHLVDGAMITGLPEPSADKDLLHTNLIPITIPTYIYEAKLTLDKESISELYPDWSLRGDRAYVVALLSNNASDTPREFVCRQGSLVSFRPLAGSTFETLGIVDPDTCKQSLVYDYHAMSISNESTVTQLLRTVLQFQLKEINISWQHNEKHFIFTSSDLSSPRSLVWTNRKKSRRNVVSQIESADSASPKVYKHFGFRVSFMDVDGKWFATIEPKWLFSQDGYERSYAHSKLAANTARMEKNSQLYQHNRFIAWLLQGKLRSDQHTIMFDKNVIVEGSSTFTDKEWTQKYETD